MRVNMARKVQINRFALTYEESIFRKLCVMQDEYYNVECSVICLGAEIFS